MSRLRILEQGKTTRNNMNKTDRLCKLCVQDRSCRLNDVYDKLQQLKGNEEEKINYDFLNNTKVRFLNPQGEFDYSRLSEIIKVDEDFYLLTNRDGYEKFHDDTLNVDLKGYKFLIKITYAGLYSYLRDIHGNRIFLYDIVGGYNSDGRYLSGVITIDGNNDYSFLAVDTWRGWGGDLPMFIGFKNNAFCLRPDSLKKLGQLDFRKSKFGEWPEEFDASEKTYKRVRYNNGGTQNDNVISVTRSFNFQEMGESLQKATNLKFSVFFLYADSAKFNWSVKDKIFSFFLRSTVYKETYCYMRILKIHKNKLYLAVQSKSKDHVFMLNSLAKTYNNSVSNGIWEYSNEKQPPTDIDASDPLIGAMEAGDNDEAMVYQNERMVVAYLDKLPLIRQFMDSHPLKKVYFDKDGLNVETFR